MLNAFHKSQAKQKTHWIAHSTAVVVIRDVRDIHIRMRSPAHTGMLIKSSNGYVLITHFRKVQKKTNTHKNSKPFASKTVEQSPQNTEEWANDAQRTAAYRPVAVYAKIRISSCFPFWFFQCAHIANNSICLRILLWASQFWILNAHNAYANSILSFVLRSTVFAGRPKTHFFFLFIVYVARASGWRRKSQRFSSFHWTFSDSSMLWIEYCPIDRWIRYANNQSSHVTK